MGKSVLKTHTEENSLRKSGSINEKYAQFSSAIP